MQGTGGAMIRKSRHMLYALSVSALLPACREEPPAATPSMLIEEGELPEISSVEALFIGHSLINFEMPRNIASIAESLDVRFEYEAQIIDGAPLEEQWNEDYRSLGVRAKERLRQRRFDVVVLAEAVPILDMIRYRSSSDYLARFASLISREQPGARIFLDEGWVHRDRSRGLIFRSNDYRRFIEDDLPKWEKVAQEAMKSSGATIRILPAGRGLGALIDAIREGEIPGIESEDELFTDAIHLSPLGNHFIAACFFAALYRQSPEGASGEVVDREGEHVTLLSAETREALYKIAWENFLSYPRVIAREDQTGDGLAPDDADAEIRAESRR